MRKFLNPIIDKLQATFPPNRLVLLLGGLLTAASSTIAAWLAAHFPGLELGATEIFVVLGAAALITIRLLDRWLDQWQAYEDVNFVDDSNQIVAELLADDDVRQVIADKYPELIGVPPAAPRNPTEVP